MPTQVNSFLEGMTKNNSDRTTTNTKFIGFSKLFASGSCYNFSLTTRAQVKNRSIYTVRRCL